MTKSQSQREKERQALVESNWVYKGRVVKLKLDTFQFEKRTKVTEIVVHPGAVVILPLDPQGRILLVQQWRRAIDDIILELPAGTLEENEDPLDCAKRELREETGFAAKKMTPFGGFFSAPGFCNEYLHLFLAEELVESPLPPDEDEMIDLVPVSIKEAKQMIAQNKIRDAKTIAGILKYVCVNG